MGLGFEPLRHSLLGSTKGPERRMLCSVSGDQIASAFSERMARNRRLSTHPPASSPRALSAVSDPPLHAHLPDPVREVMASIYNALPPRGGSPAHRATTSIESGTDPKNAHFDHFGTSATAWLPTAPQKGQIATSPQKCRTKLSLRRGIIKTLSCSSYFRSHCISLHLYGEFNATTAHDIAVVADLS